ncbi:MAG: DUF3455 domain-containing protein [Ferrovum sp.]|nr:DUF3455 domain-containing protein [Ferrovum sp.]
MSLRHLFSVSLVSALSLSACALMPRPHNTPDALVPPASQVMVLEAMGAGVQVYGCEKTADDPTKFAWVLQGPEADLYDPTGNRIARHTAGPTWIGMDGSSVKGTVSASLPAPKETEDIPWLLLTATETSGNGILSKVASIQRINTRGGIAPPASDCGAPQVGKKSRVSYTANYRFYATKP